MPNLPVEAYHTTPRLREWQNQVDPNAVEYGLGGTAYAKTRKLKQVTDEAKFWQDTHTGTPEYAWIVPYDADPI
jgi:hypothetical protein